MEKVSRERLVELLTSTNASSVTIVSVADAKMNKTNNPFYHKEGRAWVADKVVTKRSETTYNFGGSYEARVNEALVADGSTATFKSGALAWGEWLVEGKVIQYNGEFYVRVYVNRDNTSNVTYFVDGKEATESEVKTIKEFTPEKGASAKQTNEGLAEEHQIIPNNIAFSKIESITIEGVAYTL